MKLQSGLATLLSIANSLSVTTSASVLFTESIKEDVRSNRNQAACSASAFEGVWAYVSQGSGNSFGTMITCPPSLDGNCQIMDQGLNTKDCAVIGTIKTTDMQEDDKGNCYFDPIYMGLVNSNGFKQCPSVVSAKREGEYLLFLWGDKPLPDLSDPVYYNLDDPRHGRRINTVMPTVQTSNTTTSPTMPFLFEIEKTEEGYQINTGGDMNTNSPDDNANENEDTAQSENCSPPLCPLIPPVSASPSSSNARIMPVLYSIFASVGLYVWMK